MTPIRAILGVIPVVALAASISACTRVGNQNLLDPFGVYARQGNPGGFTETEVEDKVQRVSNMVGGERDWKEAQRFIRSPRKRTPDQVEDHRGKHMRKLTAIVAALGLLGSTSLTPVVAATTDNIAKSDDLSAAKKKKAKKAKKKDAGLAISDLSAVKTPKKKAKKKKKRGGVRIEGDFGRFGMRTHGATATTPAASTGNTGH